MKLILLAATIALAAPAFAQDSTAAPTPAQPVAPKEKKVCRHESVLGSNIPARICLTKAEWSELDKHYENTDQGFIERRKDSFNNMPMPH